MFGAGPVRRFLRYAGARIRERSTIAAVSGALPTALQLASPWCWFVILVAIAVALMPTSTSPDPNGATQ
jgi:hypothetical protein